MIHQFLCMETTEPVLSPCSLMIKHSVVFSHLFPGCSPPRHHGRLGSATSIHQNTWPRSPRQQSQHHRSPSKSAPQWPGCGNDLWRSMASSFSIVATLEVGKDTMCYLPCYFLIKWFNMFKQSVGR